MPAIPITDLNVITCFAAFFFAAPLFLFRFKHKAPTLTLTLTLQLITGDLSRPPLHRPGGWWGVGLRGRVKRDRVVREGRGFIVQLYSVEVIVVEVLTAFG